MGAFQYTALDAAGRERQGVLEGDTPRHVRQLLREKQLLPVSVDPVADRAVSLKGRSLWSGRGVSGGDVALLTRGEPELVHSRTLAGFPLRLPALDVNSVGAGGGSIAWVDDGGRLRVGPQSAGADPGPACYGKGGTEPATTDAHIVIGTIRPGAFLGGRMTLDGDAARRAFEPIAARFDLDSCDLDDLFLESLRTEAERIGASWDVVLAADAKAHDSSDWANLQRLVERALPGIEGRLRSGQKTCLALHPGLLARYGHMNLIGGLAADVGRAGGPRGLWVLTPDNGQHTLPTLNGAPIPITNPTQHTRLTSAWLRNEHRAGAAN